jgi:hypothetical protein
MRTPEPDDEDLDVAPGETQTEAYRATTGRQGGAPLYLWCVTEDPARAAIYPIADIRKMEPPAQTKNSVAFIHFSNESVGMYGDNLHRVLNRITLRSCSALYEIRPGQHPVTATEPVIRRMEFYDMTKAKPKASGEKPN